MPHVERPQVQAVHGCRRSYAVVDRVDPRVAPGVTARQLIRVVCNYGVDCKPAQRRDERVRAAALSAAHPDRELDPAEHGCTQNLPALDCRSHELPGRLHSTKVVDED